ncbi:MAG TPA: dihydroorotase [Firmicutes bacterium]|nr:dihydroorotase [Bacillota bacterium]
MRLLLKGGRVIDPANGIDGALDVLIQDGRIAAVGDIPQGPEIGTCLDAGLDAGPGANAGPGSVPCSSSSRSDHSTTIVNCRGKIVCPGFIDLHAHLREPGYEYKEDIASGSRAAAAGGFTTICCMPNTNPVIDNGAVAGFVRRRAQEVGLVNVLPIGAITKKQAGEELAEMGELVAAGCVAVSDDGKPVMRSDVMRHALEYSRLFGIPVLSHCEDANLSDGQMHEGYYSTVYGLKGIPAEAEEIMVARDIVLARLTRARLHICHVSTKGALEAVRQAKALGLPVTCEATPHHLALTDEAVGSYDTDTKVNPPLRSAEHVQALREALASGLVDCIATDHAPHHIESKDCEYGLASCGISGIETAIAVIMDRLVRPGLLDVAKMVSLFTTGPAGIIESRQAADGMDQGTSDLTANQAAAYRGALTPGAPADVTIIDPELARTVNPRQFYSRGKNTPFKGMELTGWPCMTIVGGRIVAQDGRVVGQTD